MLVIIVTVIIFTRSYNKNFTYFLLSSSLYLYLLILFILLKKKKINERAVTGITLKNNIVFFILCALLGFCSPKTKLDFTQL